MTNTATTSRPSLTTGNHVFTAIRMLRKHWGLLVASVLLCAGAMLLYSRSVRKIYQASTLLEIDPHANQPLKDHDALNIGAGSYWDTRDYYETQYKIISSNRVLSAVARDLGLASVREFTKDGTLEEATLFLSKRVAVEPVRASRLVFIRVNDTDPKRAQKICDAIAGEYISENLESALTSTSDAVTWLNGQVDHVKKDLERDENSLYEFKERNNLPSTSINEASNMLRVEMQELDTVLTHTRTRHAELSARYAELAKAPTDSPDQLPASEFLSSPYLQELRKQYQDAVRDHAGLVADGKGDNHPLVREAVQKIAETKNALLAEVRNIRDAVARDLAVVIREEASESALFEASRKRAVEMNMKEIEYHRLDRTRDENEKLYGLLLEHLKDADLARMMKANNIRVVDPAPEPKDPIRPRLLLNTGVGALFGLLLGVGLGWIREQLDSSLKTPADIEEALGVPFLGLLPEVSEEGASTKSPKRRRRRREGAGRATGALELIVHHEPTSGIAEAARSIRTNILFSNPDHPYRILLVTSAAPSEGKTTVACSIATALAQGGERVCIVDCDLRRPRLHRILGRTGDSGVTNVLVGDATVEQVAKSCEVANLWAIPAGPIPPNPADMLQSERFRQFIASLGEQFDRVVIDSPPLVAVTDSAIISRLVDGTVFVVRAFKTSRHVSAQGLRALRDVDAAVVGTVLNAVNLDHRDYGYYSYYYYKGEGYRSIPAAANDDDKPAAPH